MFKNYSAIDLGAITLRGTIYKVGIHSEYFLSSYDFTHCDVFMGNVLSAGIGQAPSRQAALFAGTFCFFESDSF